MCDMYWQKKGDKWVLVVAEEDELLLGAPAATENLVDFEFPPITPVLDEPREKRRPRALVR